MKFWVTEIRAQDPETERMTTWMGPNVPGSDIHDAEAFCQRNGLGYCKVVAELDASYPCKANSTFSDFTHATEYEKPNLN